MDAIVVLLKEMVFFIELCDDLGVKIKLPRLLTDSKSAVDIIKNPGVTKRSTHFERRLHYAREMYLHGRFVLHLVSTHDMMADGMTKVVDRDKFFKCRNYVMNVA